MELGFDTVGNATLIVYDRGPLLVTDPWLGGDAYFGSWTLSHAIPPEQLQAATDAKFVWFSHGHPDHLNGAWLKHFTARQILLPDHVGGRIRNDLQRAGLTVTVLPHATWTPLSDRVRVWCFADVNQDAILLVDIDGVLVVNINDATQTGWGPAVRREIKRFRQSVLLQLSGFGDADMINFVDENGVRQPPLPQLRKDRGYRVGDALAKTADGLGATHVVPFSSMHRYQRADTAWANEYAVTTADYSDGFASRRAVLHSPFMRYDRTRDEWSALDPAEQPVTVVAPAQFGDDWSEELTTEERDEVGGYIKRVQHFEDSLDFITFRVGGRDNTVDLGGRRTGRGITFAVPRASLLTTVRHQIFDDLLIGNFMQTTLHGPWGASGLGSGFGKYLTRYADNGHAYTKDEVAEYLAVYASRLATLDKVRNALEGRGARLLRSTFEVDSAPYRAARRAYWAVKKATR